MSCLDHVRSHKRNLLLSTNSKFNTFKDIESGSVGLLVPGTKAESARETGEEIFSYRRSNEKP